MSNNNSSDNESCNAAQSNDSADSKSAWDRWDSEDTLGDPYHNAATLLTGNVSGSGIAAVNRAGGEHDDDVSSVASSSEITLANINLAGRVVAAQDIMARQNDDYSSGSSSDGMTGKFWKNSTRDGGGNGRKMATNCSSRRTIGFAIFALLTFLAASASLFVVARYSDVTRSSYSSALDTSQSLTQNLVPVRYANLSDVSQPDDVSTIPFLWDMPGDGNIYERVYTRCLNLVAAGGALGDSSQTDVGPSQPLAYIDHNDSRFINVYLGDANGLRRGMDTKFVQSGMVDVIYAPLIYQASRIFTESNKGKLFALIPNPVDRIASAYVAARRLVPYLSNATFEEYYSSDRDNYMTRELSGGLLRGVATEQSFEVAKAVLRAKCLVGLSTQILPSIDRTLHYFNWENRIKVTNFDSCAQQVINEPSSDQLLIGYFKEGSPEYNIIVQQNGYDMRLFEFAEMLFNEQLETGVVSSGGFAGAKAAAFASSASRPHPFFAFAIGFLVFAILGWRAI